MAQSSMIEAHVKYRKSQGKYDFITETPVYSVIAGYKQGSAIIKDKIGYYTFGKHDTRSLIFDGDGMAERGKEGILAKSLGDFSHEMEQIPNTTNAIASLAASTIGKMIYQKEDGSIGFKLPFTGRASDDYRNAPTTYQNMKIKCGDLVNGMVDRVKDYTTGILDKLPDIQNDSRLAYER